MDKDTLQLARHKKFNEFKEQIIRKLEQHIHERLEEQKAEAVETFAEGLKQKIRRIRGGKMQKLFVSTKKGFRMQGGKVVKMKQTERRKRRIAAKKRMRKLRGKQGMIKRRRNLSLKKRRARSIKDTRKSIGQ
jgi:hypothetical protein